MQRGESGASVAPPGLDRDAPMTASGNETVLDPPLITECYIISGGTEEIELEPTRGADKAPVAADTSRLSTVVPPSENTSIESGTPLITQQFQASGNGESRPEPGDQSDARPTTGSCQKSGTEFGCLGQ